MAEVLHIFLAFVHGQSMREVEEARAIADRGLEGCIHGRPGSRRQVLLMDAETLATLGLTPGVVKENITTNGLALGSLGEGQRLRIGQALFEVIVPCHPCDRMDEIRQGLREEIRGRRGMLCRVVEGGQIRCGDAIELVNYSSLGS